MLALATALFSGVANFVNKFAIAGFSSPILFTTLKNTLVAVALLGILIAFKKMPELKRLSPKEWFLLLAIGVIGGALPFGLFFTGLAQTSALNAAFIHKSLFLWVALLALPFLKERMTREQWLGIGVIFLANCAIGGFSGFAWNSGEAMILGATMLWAVENVIAKKALISISSTVVAAARMIIGSVLLLTYSLATTSLSPVTLMQGSQWGWVILTALLLSGYVLTWYAALKRAPATYVATLLVPATLITNILSTVFITHTFTSRDWGIAALYLAGVLLLVVFAKKTLTTDKLAGIPAGASL